MTELFDHLNTSPSVAFVLLAGVVVWFMIAYRQFKARSKPRYSTKDKQAVRESARRRL
jgi:hypothetical protein